MWRLLTRTKKLSVTLCERCAEVCDQRCWRTGLRERALLQQLCLGTRV